VPALFDTGALELLRRRYRRVESLALKNYPPVVCSHVVGEYIYAQFQTRATDATVISARLFLAPFEMLAQTSLTPDLFAQVRARLLGHVLHGNLIVALEILKAVASIKRLRSRQGVTR